MARKYLLNDSKELLSLLIDKFDKNNINPAYIKKLEEKVLKDPKFNEKDAWNGSKAAGYLYGWVKAQYDYYKVYVTTEPLRKQLIEIEAIVSEKKEILA